MTFTTEASEVSFQVAVPEVDPEAWALIAEAIRRLVREHAVIGEYRQRVAEDRPYEDAVSPQELLEMWERRNTER